MPASGMVASASRQVKNKDAALFDRVLSSFVPPGVYDAHAHLYRRDLLGDQYTPMLNACPAIAGFHTYQDSLSSYMADRAPRAGLFFAYPTMTMDVEASNQFVRNEVARVADARALMLIRPEDNPNDTEAQVTRYSYAGFKVYHLFADQSDTMNAPNESFLPEWAWQLANRHRLVIMLHIVLPVALQDPRNQRYIHEHCRRYPEARLILAHAARGFCGRHTTDSIRTLCGLENVFFDSSAICEPEPFEAILKTFGPTRLLFGSDYPVSTFRGRNVSVGDGFYWLYDTNSDWDGWVLGELPPCGIQSLLALRHACRILHLNDRDIELIFYGNARRVLKLDPPGDGRVGQALYDEAKKLIPGATQLFGKRQEVFAPRQWPPYFVEARGCELIDLDGRQLLDFDSNGIGTCLLGYNDPDVTAAVLRRVTLGAMSTLNSPAEIDLARLLLEMHPWAEQVRFARTGGESMAIAVRIARAATGRNRVAICGYHGWSDWYLAGNLPHEDVPLNDPLGGQFLPNVPIAGVPSLLAGSVLPFTYNHADELATIVRKHGGELAAVVMEPTRTLEPASGFFEAVRELCDRCGARLVIDEITTGFRLHRGGAHMKYGVEPDVAVFAKALGNGHPIGAIIGKSETMRAAQDSFISSTYWTEAVGPHRRLRDAA